MRHLWLALVLVASTACVSGKLAKANLDSVDALGAVAVTHDPINEPEATAAVDNAQAIVEATAPLQQITHLGVPTDLVDKNTVHVENLSTAVTPIVDQPKVKMAVDRAKKNAEELSGVAHQQATWKGAIPTGLPWVDTAMQILALIGSGVGVVYGATRGQNHVRRWWNTPGAKPPTPPNSDTAAKPVPGELASTKVS